MVKDPPRDQFWGNEWRGGRALRAQQNVIGPDVEIGPLARVITPR